MNEIKWLDMDEAPYNGTRILAYDDMGDVYIIKWDKEDRIWVIAEASEYDEETYEYMNIEMEDPLGWIPLPKIPKEK